MLFRSKLSDILGRPAPEFRGAQVDVHDQGNLSWLIESSVRGNIKSSHSRTMAFTTMDASWDDGLSRAMQRLLARLCEEHKEELENSPFGFYGRRDAEGRRGTSWTWRSYFTAPRRTYAA